MKSDSSLRVPLLLPTTSDDDCGGGATSNHKSVNSSNLRISPIERLSKRGVFFVFAFFLLIFYVSPMYKSISGLCETPLCLPHHHLFWEATAPGYLVYTSSCKISEMNPFDKAVRSYIRKKGPQRCPKFLVRVEGKLLKYDEKNPKYKRTSCCFREIRRISEDPEKYDRNADWKISISPTCTQIPKTEAIEATSEFLKIDCEELEEEGKIHKFSDYLAAVFLPEEHSNLTRAKANYWHENFNPELIPPSEMVKKEIPGIPPSVLIVGIDSISRMHMMRSLPKTKGFLERNDFIEMKGYTKIGENTFPNIMGAVGGMELEHYPCWNRGKDWKLDNCPLIWRNYSGSNYATALLEDSPGLAIFNYLKTGFVEQPVDYYLRTLAVAYHGKMDHSRGYQGCVGGMTQTDYMVKYMRDFVLRMGEGQVPYFLLSWFTSLAHDDFNALKPADETFHDLLSDAVHDPSYNGNNTIILFISDHGYRFGSFRETFLGYYEESLPFFFMRLPPGLKASRPHWYENLRLNSHRLTSPLDFHATLEDILSLSYPGSNITYTHSNWSPSFRKVYSFFEDTPLNRTCESSGIPQLYCRCGVTPAVGKKSKTSEQFGHLVIKSVNMILHDSIQNKTCIPLKFSKFLYIRELSEGEIWNNFGKLISFKDHIVALSASPSDAHFEAKIRLFKNETMSVVGEISRINSYQGQNDCLKDYKLKNYCMCKDYYDKQQLVKKTKEAKKKLKEKKKARKTTIFHKFTKAPTSKPNPTSVPSPRVSPVINSTIGIPTVPPLLNPASAPQS